jgi:hypothetical protein
MIYFLRLIYRFEQFLQRSQKNLSRSRRALRRVLDSSTREVVNSWNVVQMPGQDERSFTLTNPSRTLVRHSRRVRPDIGWFMNRMEELNVPIGFTKELSEINFTVLDAATDANYWNGKIQIAMGNNRRNKDRAFIHELGHHVEDLEDIAGIEEIVLEKKTSAHFLPDKYARKNVSEYIAVGFEFFYCGTSDQKRKMRKRNPRLYRVISQIHKKYSKM